MTTLADIRARSTWGDILEGQPQHAGLAVLLSAGACALMIAPTGDARFFGLSALGWATVSIALAILHQAIVAFVFRLQLHRNLLSHLFGDRDMHIWRIIFLPLLIVRPITVFLTGWADPVSIGMAQPIEWLIGGLFLALAIWGMHSVLTHFTIRRALGGDHFRDEIAALPLVRKGLFKYTDNAMYGVVFLGLWGIALLCDSWNALVLAFFQHCYIWVHMYCTEKPDMEWIYGNR